MARHRLRPRSLQVSMRRPMSRLLAVLVASLLALGCSDSLAPEDVAGLYVLERIGSDPLPAVLSENDYGVVRVTSGAIRLRSDGSGTVSGVQESIPWHDVQSASGPIWSENPIRFRTVGDRIEIEFLCPAYASCIPAPHMVARRTTDGLRASWFQSPTVMHYTRVVSPD